MLFVVAFLGGVLTILSPCIWPVLPFVFLRSGQPFRTNGLPLLLGMAATFAAVATLAAVGGSWIVAANRYGRWLALGLLLLFAAALLSERVADRLSRPLVALGAKLGRGADQRAGPGASLLLGAATGLLWTPCAGPILGLVLTGAALGGASVETSLLLLAYALGCAVSLSAALLLGGRALAVLKRSLGADVWIRRALGGTVALGVLAIALGLDRGFLAARSTASTTAVEQSLLSTLLGAREPRPDSAPLGGAMMSAEPRMTAAGAAMIGPAMTLASPAEGRARLPVEGTLPPLDGATAWLNSKPLTAADLRGKIVLIDFWTYSCINCLRALPYVEAWHEKYREAGLVVIGVHSPEFAFEKDLGNVEREVRNLGVRYPVAVDNDFAVWRAFGNEYWPAHYLIDASGRIRHHHFGEGDYDAAEAAIRELLAEAGRSMPSDALVDAAGTGVSLESNALDVLSPETYVGYRRARSFASPGGQRPDVAYAYSIPLALELNHWALEGRWAVGAEAARLAAAHGRLALRFQARDVHLVLGADSATAPVAFRVRIDGAAPGEDHGVDVDADGNGVVSTQRLYQLIRQSDAGRDRIFEIEFFGPDVAVYSITFG